MSTINNAHALVVGIAHYQTVSPLPATVLNDARAIAQLLTDPRYCGYTRGNVQLLLDGQASLEGLREGLARLAATTNADSTVTIFFSGHGGRVGVGPQQGEYLLPADADVSSPEALSHSSLSSGELSAAFAKIPARKLVVIFDCCHAGGMGEPKAAAVPWKSGILEDTYARLMEGRGRVILASSRSGELSWVLPNARNSLFTQCLLEGLRGDAPSEDGLIRIFDLYRYIQPRVTAAEPRQHPVFKAQLEDDFPVALYCGGAKGIIPRDAQGFVYDGYISYADQDLDHDWVWRTLVPRLRAAGLSIAVAHDVEQAGIARVVNIERAVRESKFTVMVLSSAYLKDRMAEFTDIIAQTLGVDEGQYRLLPVLIEPVELPPRLAIYEAVNFTNPKRVESQFERLVRALLGPVPRS